MLPCVCSVIDNRRRQNVVRKSVTLIVLTTFWRHLRSITEQTHGNVESICEVETRFLANQRANFLRAVFLNRNKYAEVEFSLAAKRSTSQRRLTLDASSYNANDRPTVKDICKADSRFGTSAWRVSVLDSRLYYCQNCKSVYEPWTTKKCLECLCYNQKQTKASNWLTQQTFQTYFNCPLDFTQPAGPKYISTSYVNIYLKLRQ